MTGFLDCLLRRANSEVIAVAATITAIVTPIAIVMTTLRKKQFEEPVPSALAPFTVLRAKGHHH